MTTSFDAEPDTTPIDDLGVHHIPKWLYVLIASAIAALAIVTYARTHHRATVSPYVTAPVSRGEIVETVEATGNLQAVLSVQVGAQVSGRIQTLHADFNSRVHAGDLLADIDPTPFNAAVAQAQAGVLAARAQLLRSRADMLLARQNEARQRGLRALQMNAVSELETAIDSLNSARAQVSNSEAMLRQAEAALTTAQTNLSYTHIHAPIDGVVVTRSVDVGQTVASSFQTPTLFVIANDLRHMQVIGNVDESDVGRLRVGMAVEAHVDAFPTQVFHGTISQIRYQSTMIQGVVTYPAVIDVDNPEEKLFPGMTATIDVVTARRENVIRVPNAALRYRPNGTPGAATSASRLAPRGGSGRVFVLRDNVPTPITVHTGITDGLYTEAEGTGLEPGMPVVTDQISGNAPRPGGGSSARGSPRPF